MTARTAGPGHVRPRWRLAPLLALRSLAEERERADLGRALAAVRRVQDEAAAARRKLLALQGGLPGAWTMVFGAELVGLDRHLERLRRDVAGWRERAGAADAAATAARRRHAWAREARQALEREQERWLEARRRDCEAALEREVDDLSASRRR